MDLAESILNELVSLQKKNEDLLGIIRRLEHESDVIIRQFEDKISDLNKELKKALDVSAKSEKKYDLLIREKYREQEIFEKEKQETISEYSGRISEIETRNQQFLSSIEEKDNLIRTITEEKGSLELSLAQKTDELNSRITELHLALETEKEQSESRLSALRSELEQNILNVREDLAKKETELRTLAHDLKSRIETEKKTRAKWDKEKGLFEKKIADLQVQVKTGQEEKKFLQSESTRENARLTKSIQDLQYEIASLEKAKNKTQVEYESRIAYLTEENNRLLEKLDADAVAIDTLSRQNQELHDLSEQLNADISENESQITLLLSKIEILTTETESKVSLLLQETEQVHLELEQKNIQAAELEQELSFVQDENRKSIQNLENSLENLRNEYSALLEKIQNQENEFTRERAEFTDEITHLSNDLNEAVRLKDQREQEFRDEISYLHEELIRRKEEWKEKIESGARDLAERDRQLSLISGNNEALRAELERVRSRLLMLEKTIREDKEEPVHALYRQIQNLSAKLAGKDSENALLASRVIRLDTENTRLAQLLVESGIDEEIIHPSADEIPPDKNKPAALTISDISAHLSNLEDPVHAMEAAAAILRSGPQVTDILIPLLYRGTLNRRAWIAVMLYELNDPKATKPLSDLLEASESGLRELIWDTRLRFREYRRSGTVSSVAQ